MCVKKSVGYKHKDRAMVLCECTKIENASTDVRMSECGNVRMCECVWSRRAVSVVFVWCLCLRLFVCWDVACTKAGCGLTSARLSCCHCQGGASQWARSHTSLLFQPPPMPTTTHSWVVVSVCPHPAASEQTRFNLSRHRSPNG